jgi:hypothetical protein
MWTFCKTISLGENSDKSEDILNGIYGLRYEKDCDSVSMR